MSSGIIRMIDELGRIVIPKEIRDLLHIKSGNKLEISVSNNNVILRKRQSFYYDKESIVMFTDCLYSYTKKDILIIGKDEVIYFKGDSFKNFKIKTMKEQFFESIINLNGKEKSLSYFPFYVRGILSANIISISDEKLNKEIKEFFFYTLDIMKKYFEN